MIDRESSVWYSNFTNLDAGSARPYWRGDRLVRGSTGLIDYGLREATAHLAARLYERHNRDDRPDWELCPSMSIGDVIMFRDGEAVTVDREGFTPVTVAGLDLIVDRPWIDVIAGVDFLPEHLPLPLARKLIWGEYGVTCGGWRPLPWDRPPLSLERGNGLIYECWYNVDGWRGYRPGNRLVRAWRDIVSWTDVAPPSEVLAEAIFDRHQHVDFDVGRGFGPDDVVMLGDVAISVMEDGVGRVDVDPADLIVDRSYWDVYRDRRPAPGAAESVLDSWRNPSTCRSIAQAGVAVRVTLPSTACPDTDLEL